MNHPADNTLTARESNALVTGKWGFSTDSQISESAGKQGAEQLLEVCSSSFFIIEAVTNSRKYSALFKFRVEQGSRKQVLESNTKKLNQQQKQDIHLPIHSKSYRQPCCEDSAP